MKRKGILFIISAPSGSGKTTLCRKLLGAIDGLKRSVSMTTRRPRKGELNYRDYIFIERDDFLRRRFRGEFLEWANVFGEYYGTPKTKVEKYLKKGLDVLLSIDVQGANKIKKLNLRAVYIFVAPPSLCELQKRLILRSTEKPKDLKTRLVVAKKELKSIKKYDYIVVNDNLEDAILKLKSIVIAERCRIGREGWDVLCSDGKTIRKNR